MQRELPGFLGIIISLQRLIYPNTVYISNLIIFVELFTDDGRKVDCIRMASAQRAELSGAQWARTSKDRDTIDKA